MKNNFKTFLIIVSIFFFTFGLVVGSFFLLSTSQAEEIEKKDKQQETATKIFAGDEDEDQDGLSTNEELALGTDPKNPDTDGDGFNDGQEVFFGYNPIDDGPTVRRRQQKENGLNALSPTLTNGQDSDHDFLSDQFETIIGTDPQNPDSDGDGFSDSQEILNGFDPLAQNQKMKLEISIPKINVKAPIILPTGTSQADFISSLKQGVINYPGTALPGQLGNSFITGHSSDYLWHDGSYKYIFKDLNNLEKNDEIIFTYTLSNNRTFSYTYQVLYKKVVAADSAELFADSTSASATIVTCWPLNTSLKRLMLKTTLIK